MSGMRKLVPLALAVAALAAPTASSAQTSDPLPCEGQSISECLSCAGSCIPGCSGDVLLSCAGRKLEAVIYTVGDTVGDAVDALDALCSKIGC